MAVAVEHSPPPGNTETYWDLLGYRGAGMEGGGLPEGCGKGEVNTFHADRGRTLSANIGVILTINCDSGHSQIQVEPNYMIILPQKAMFSCDFTSFYSRGITKAGMDFHTGRRSCHFLKPRDLPVKPRSRLGVAGGLCRGGGVGVQVCWEGLPFWGGMSQGTGEWRRALPRWEQ